MVCPQSYLILSFCILSTTINKKAGFIPAFCLFVMIIFDGFLQTYKSPNICIIRRYIIFCCISVVICIMLNFEADLQK